MATDKEFQATSDSKKEIVKNLPIIKLYENDDLILFTTPDSFKELMEEWLELHPHLKEDAHLMRLVLNEVREKSVINCYEICTKNNLHHRLTYRVADFLDNGKCYIFNKKTATFEEKIEVETYSFQLAPMVGSSGRKYSLPNAPFFETEDSTS